MQIERLITEVDHQPLIRNLYQFYAYESSDWEEEDIEVDGQFYINDQHLAQYWQAPGWRAEIILADGFIAGFALIERVEIDQQWVSELADLFILRKYRGHGIASHIAQEIMSANQTWLLCSYAHDRVGQAFCQQLLKRLARGVQTLPQLSDDPQLQRFLITPVNH